MTDPKTPRKRVAPSRAPKSLPDVAIVTVQLARSTGEISVDDEFSTPLETWAMLEWASETVKERLLDRHESE